MEKIAVPKTRAYFQASRNEPERLICWIPAEEYPSVVDDDSKRERLKRFYPDGIEVEVSDEGFWVLESLGIELPKSPGKRRQTFGKLRQGNRLPESGVVSGTELEKEIAGPHVPFRGPAPATGRRLREPKMGAGKNPGVVVSRIR